MSIRGMSTNQYATIIKEGILKNIKEVFFADGTVDILEKELFATLKKILL